MLRKHGFRARVLNVGGGLGVRYTEGDDPPEVEEYCRFVSESVREGLGDSGLAPTLFHEPGRALVAESGVTLYEVGVVKTVPIGPGTTRTYVCVDGGLSDNPRPAIYGAEYTVERVARREDAPAASSLINPSPDGESGDSRALGESGDSRSSGSSAFRESGFRQSGERSTARFTVSGRHCETDRLFPDVSLPPDVEPGDLLQVLCTGAYSSSMASNYNRYPRPATALVRTDGRHELVQEREAWDAMFARERVPGDLG
jgi:diaminopimelate decarboxylase